MRKGLFSFPWNKYISGFLIFALLFSQTIRMDFFSQVEAKPEQYRDIVSIFVDTATYAKTRSKITQYAEDIQSYLGSTRVSLFVVDSGTDPVKIAAKNEKLYYEGDGGTGVSRLVGTILIGNIPIPMVDDAGSYFPTLYPYVDFVDKAFVYHPRLREYKASPEANRKTIEADIWHGVINPAIGRDWNESEDIQKVSNFLDKTHAFYTKSGKFTPTTTPPRVFYYDGEYESKSVNLRSLFQYSLTMKNSENIAYKRFTKYLLEDINRTLLEFDTIHDQEFADFAKSLGLSSGGDGFDPATVKDMQDTHTKIPILTMLKDFQSIINKATLSDALANVHNAGRYNNETNVRVDIAPLQMTIMDDIARSTLRESNNALMRQIDGVITSSVKPARIPIFDSIIGSGSQYDNYFFGSKSSLITSPEQCSIARGSNVERTEFGKDVLVEANVAYDIKTTEGHANKLKADTEELVKIHKSAGYSCFNGGTSTPLLDAYWGGNSLMRVVGSSTPETIMKDAPGGAMKIKGFSEPIFSLGGMKETTRLAPPTIADCMDGRYQYALKAPYTFDYTQDLYLESTTTYTCTAGYPKEWNMPEGMCPEKVQATPRFTCLTDHDIRSSIPGLEESKADYASRPCLVGKVFVDGTVVADARRPCTETIGTGQDATTVDTTVYEDRVFHTIPSLLHHISPTDDEIQAAEDNGVTPSLPVDMVRYVEFLTQNGKIARINYPNFFSAPAGNRAEFRAWLKALSEKEWKAVAESTGAPYIDWNSFISDETADTIIRAKNWLNPDVTTKYKQAIETNLSYSQEYPGLPSEKQPLKYPTKNAGYEIAYLGLSPFTPASSENIDDTISNIIQDYDLGLREIQGLNISEPYDPGIDNPYANSDKCGPPEGVDLFQWPSAIMCWISSLLPPRIIAGSCGANTIGISNSTPSVISPPNGYSGDGEKMREFYEGGKLTYALERTSMTMKDTLEAKFQYAKNNTYLRLTPGSQMRTVIVSVKDRTGNLVPENQWENYIHIDPNQIEATGYNDTFLYSTKGSEGVIELKAVLTLLLPGGATLEKTSDILTLRINSEYLRVIPKNGNQVSPFIDVTESTNVKFDVEALDATGTLLTPVFPLKLTIIDDVSGVKIETDKIVPSPEYTLPESVTKKVGVYRLLLRDSQDRIGETTLAVRAGKLARIVVSPVSNMIQKGSNTLVIVRLQDRLGNPVSPDLNRITIDVNGGYLSDANGEKKSSMTIDAMESDIPLLFGSDSTGTASLSLRSDGGITTTATIQIIENIRVILSRASNPIVGGDPVNITLKIVDGRGNLLDSFASVASLDLPDDAGYFSEESIEIKNGKTNTFTYIPGTRSATHKLRIDIPGIGSISDIDFTLLPGIPLYVTHTETDTNIIFSLNDRYGNTTSNSLPGTLIFNTDQPKNILFTGGILSLEKKSGYYTLNVPELRNSKLSYTDTSGEHSLSGIALYATYIKGPRERFDFLPDYNARYTVLYGDTFLREGEDILYNSSSNNSQSLAVTTLLDSPYIENNLVSVTPGGKITLSESLDDILLESSISLQNGYPFIHIRDTVYQRSIAHILYRLDNARLLTCTTECSSGVVQPTLILSPNTSLGFTGQISESSRNITLQNGQTSFLTVSNNGKLVLAPNTTLSLQHNASSAGVVFDIESAGAQIGTLTYITDTTRSVELTDTPETTSIVNTPIIDRRSSTAVKRFSPDRFLSEISGYTFFTPQDEDMILDEKKLAPNSVDSLAHTHDTPGIGWKGNNRSLLSYAAGDTVGEATKWFHTYTMVNMGDPVAHVDHMAPGTVTEGIDRTIGTQITSSIGASILSYAHRDMDKDGLEDIITLDRDGYLNLILNLGSKFRPRQSIAYLPDLVTRGISLGDFRGDGYADILSLDNSGSIVFIDNTERRFVRMDPTVSGSTLPSGIREFKIYDMDADKKDDIIYLNENGELGILYGTSNVGVFQKKILDDSLGVTLSSTPESVGGVIYFDGIPQIPSENFGVNASTGAELDGSLLQSEVYYQHTRPRVTANPSQEISDIQSIEKAFDDNFSTTGSITDGSLTQTYIKSEYASAYDLEISRSWKNLTNAYIHAGDRILAEITIKNTSNQLKKDVQYLDTIAAVFDSSETKTYDLLLGTEKLTRSFERDSFGQYDAFFVGRDIPPGQTLTIRYELRALPASYGEMLVGNLEGGESGFDTYGDVGFKGSISCGADMLLWRSGPGAREYVRGTRTFTDPEIPDSIRDRVVDADKNGTPDSMENMTTEELDTAYKGLLNSTSTTGKSLLTSRINPSNNSIELGFDDAATTKIASMMQDFFDGLSCGFGGGSCMSFPVNWAPLAPGGAPSIFGFPAFPMLPELGLPKFSGLTWQQIKVGPVIMCVPSVYPVSVQGVGPGVCSKPSPGGSLGTWDATNNVRIYFSPTLTLGMGGAICFSHAALNGRFPGPLWGFIKGGNCIVLASPMPFCKGDGSTADGDVRGVSGLGSTTDAWNAGSCKIVAKTTDTQRMEDKKIQKDIVAYLKNPTKDKGTAIYTAISQKGPRTITIGPAIRIGGGSSGGTEVGVEIDTSKPFTLGNIIKVKNGRVPAFPDFLMKWLSQQVDELTSGLFTAPNIVIIWPSIVGSNLQFDGNWNNFTKRITDSYSAQTLENIKTQMGQAYSSTDVTKSFLQNKPQPKSGLGKDFQNLQEKFLSGDAGKLANKVAGGVASVRAAYKMIGQLPLLNIRRVQLAIDVPWPVPGELDKYLRAWQNYEKEYNTMLDNWCANKTAKECADAKSSLGTSKFINSVRQNISRIQEYKNFPLKLQKYVTWKQRYMTQVLCNVETVRQVFGGWIKDNGVRFRKWAELFVLIKAIAESWQPILDVFTDADKGCKVCSNQRNNTMTWKLKIISMVLPTPPVIRFPRWPDIVLDLSDIRLGININVPDFTLNVKPLRLPDLPRLSLPNSPSLMLSLPGFDVLPPLPSLPDLPDLPSLPRIVLPNLPPPPKIPKIFGSVSAMLNIAKLYQRVRCFLNGTMLAPEGEVGSIIAQRTERQGKLGSDFLGIQFPNFTLPSIKEIRVSTHVNFELRSDFVTEFARQAIKPLNEFTSDLGRSIPRKVGEDVNISLPKSTIDLTPRSENSTSPIPLATLEDINNQFERESQELLDTDDFTKHILAEFKFSGLETTYAGKLEKNLSKTQKETDALTMELLDAHNKKYDALVRYIQAEYDSTAELQNVIDMITDDSLGNLSYGSESSRALLVSDTSHSKTEDLFDTYTTLNTGILPDKAIAYNDAESLDAVMRIKNRMSRIADASSSASSSASSAEVMAGYSPSFDGVYVLTPSGLQTRLFDFTEALESNEKIDTVDIDKDGDKDYIYRLNGALFIKYTGAPHRSENPDTGITIGSITAPSSLPTAPNFFHETTNSPGSLNISFTPSDDRERDWRMIFYDRYLEWDFLRLGQHIPRDTPDQVIDFYAESPRESLIQSGALYSSFSLRRSLDEVYERESFLLKGPKITKLPSGTNFTLSLGRNLYVGKNPVSLILLEGTGAGTPINLAPYRYYTFRDTIKARITNGIAYTFSLIDTQETYTYSDDFIGMPLVSSMTLTAGGGGFQVREIPTNTSLKLLGGSRYSLQFLGTPETSYTTTISYPNSMYSARIKTLSVPNSVMTDIALFSPQISSDRNPPLIDFPERIRVPVYNSATFDLREYIFETNSYTLSIDEDILTDTNSNSILDDDFSVTGSKFLLEGNTLTIRPHTSLVTDTMLLRVTDERGNTSVKKISVEIYAPTPQIQSVTNSGWVIGQLSEKLDLEPVHFFRVRQGSDITKITPDATRTNKEGSFATGTYFTMSGALLGLSGARIQITERGLIELPGTGYKIEVSGANATNPLRMDLIDNQGALLYQQFLVLPEGIPLIDEKNSPTISSNALVVSPRNTYKMIPATSGDRSVPGGGYIVDENMQPIAAIAQDGNIYLIQQDASLLYGTRDGFLSLTLLVKGNPVANIWYKTTFFYTVK